MTNQDQPTVDVSLDNGGGNNISVEIDLGFDDMDPEDPNYQNASLVRQYDKLYRELPEGWSRNEDFSKTRAPYIHVSGRESFQHPNRPKMDALAKEAAAMEQSKMETQVAADRSRVKKLRMMLQSGLPMGAVEQKAKLEGIDMALVLGEVKENDDAVDPTESKTIPVPLLKKYKRMIKSGVPLKGVQVQAFVDGKFTPEDVVEALGDVLDTSKETHTEHYQPRKPKSPRRLAKEACDTLENTNVTTVAEKQYFTFNGQKVIFPADSNLASLVRKMAQTVQKRAVTSKDATMEIDSLTLYNALGALQGIIFARDRYNATCSAGGEMPFQEVKSKRQAFAEIARSIGMDLPKEFKVEVEIDGLEELIQHIEREFQDDLATLKALIDDGWYDFDSLALLYRPGSKVVAKNAGGGGVDMICQVAWNRYEQGRTIMGQPMKYFKVCFQYVVAVGAAHATIAEVVEGMESFEGRRQIHSALKFIPTMAYSIEERESLFSRYRRRGEIYNKVALQGKHVYMSYEKGCFFLKRGGGPIGGATNSSTALATGGRIIVDTQGAYDNGHSLGVGYDPMVMGIKYKYKEYSLHLRSVKQDQQASKADKHGVGDDLILFEQVPHDFMDMVWPSVVGFSLTAKGWGDVLVDGLQEIEWQEDIFDRLVLPENRKMMVKALVRHSSDSFQDLVQGKGEGTVFLMYGPPGVGKTLTAEAVAELLHKPLYSLSLGTLGTSPVELEQRLGQIMTMTAKWDALLLLDEADSFLEARSSKSSLDRNAMVSVMLKLVEYFSGILFLTSNRIDSLDPAFQTRITLALRYEQLSQDARSKVWQTLLIKSGFDKELQAAMIVPHKLAKSPLNGREIKNALRLAMAMAAEKGEVLSQTILLETVSIVNDYKATMTASNQDDPYATKKKRRGIFSLWRKHN